MEIVYHIVGKVVVMALFIYTAFRILRWVFVEVTEYLATKTVILWRMFEYLWYRDEFKEWVQDKERHPKAVAGDKPEPPKSRVDNHTKDKAE